MGSVTRTERIEGRDFPGVIRNGNHYFVRLAVYADGLVDAWGLLDATAWRRKVASGWVTPRVPDGDTLGVHHVGSFTVSHGEWDRTPDQLLAWVDGQITAMNPNRTNLRDHGGATSRRIGNINYGWPLGGMSRKPVEPGQDWVQSQGGHEAHALWRQHGETWLVTLKAWASGQVHVDGLAEERIVSREELPDLAQRGVLASSARNGWLHIHGLGRFKAANEDYVVPAQDIVTELLDEVAESMGQTSAMARCLASWERWEATQDPEALEELREDYLAVPRHLRTYILGDMDRQDGPIRRALGLP